MTQTITVTVANKQVEMELIDAQQCSELMAQDMVARGWSPVVYQAKRPRGGKNHIVYQSMRTGNFKSIASI
jgi:hypothetical protein